MYRDESGDAPGCVCYTGVHEPLTHWLYVECFMRRREDAGKQSLYVCTSRRKRPGCVGVSKAGPEEVIMCNWCDRPSKLS